VFSAIGLYPVDACGGDYIVGCPQVPGATFRWPNGKSFSIRVNGRPGARGFVKSVTLNGRPVQDWTVAHRDVIAGGVLEFEMGEKK
ncbi:MAG: glycoside hydrolase family 92 protein, partial [Kiritimatiellae bacterium]|nr:glycoside hydrolase family 92 protein [Kiritimatiellia bacterium]